MPKQEQVAIRLGDGPPAVVTRKAYENVWKDRGWKLVDSADIDATGHVAESAPRGARRRDKEE